MSAFRSRLLARVKAHGAPNWRRMSNSEALDFLRLKGVLNDFYRNFPEYAPGAAD